MNGSNDGPSIFDSKPLKELLLLNEFFYYMPHFYLWRMILDVAISSCTSFLLITIFYNLFLRQPQEKNHLYQIHNRLLFPDPIF